MGFKGQDIALVLLDRPVMGVEPVQLMTDDEYEKRQGIMFAVSEMHYAGYGPDCSLALTRSIGNSDLRVMIDHSTGLLARTVYEKTLGKMSFMCAPQSLIAEINPSMSTQERRPTMTVSNGRAEGWLGAMDKGLTIPVRGDSGSGTFVTEEGVSKLAGVVIKGGADERMFRQISSGVYFHTLSERLEDPYLTPGRLDRVLAAILNS